MLVWLGPNESSNKCYYRPQRSWDKVIFSEACVKNSVHRGGRREGVSRPRPKGEVGRSGQGGVSRPRPGGGLGRSGQGVSRPRPRVKVGASGQGGVSRPTAGGCPGPVLRGVQAQAQGEGVYPSMH